MNLEWLFVGLLAAIALALATWADALSKSRSDLLSASFILFLSWPLSSVVNLILSPPGSMLLAPVTDALFASALLYSIKRQYQTWKLVLLWLIATQGFFHVVYQTAPERENLLYFYIVELNVTYIIQLLCVAVTGGRDVVSYYRRHRLHGVCLRGPIGGPK